MPYSTESASFNPLRDPLATRDSASVVAALRQLIIGGVFGAGERLTEQAMALRLGVSRTPVRLAFRTLEQEGLLQQAGKRGFLVRAFSQEDVLCAIEVRGALEGLAARRLAQQGMPEPVRAVLQTSVDEGERVLSGGRLHEDDIGAWGELNHRFHSTIVTAGGGRVVADAIARNDHLPFASAASLVIDRTALDREYHKLSVAQMHHRLVLDALCRRESARVESLMREHACVALHYGMLWGLDSGSPQSG